MAPSFCLSSGDHGGDSGRAVKLFSRIVPSSELAFWRSCEGVSGRSRGSFSVTAPRVVKEACVVGGSPLALRIFPKGSYLAFLVVRTRSMLVPVTLGLATFFSKGF